MVKYQMGRPGSGDPYFTTEGQGRRGIYSVTGVPTMRINGKVEVFPPQMTDAAELDAELLKFSYLKITPHIKRKDDGKTFDYDVTV